MTRTSLAVLIVTAALAGCSGSSGLSTSSIFGGKKAETPAVQAAGPTSDPTTRALQVGSTSARAVKCGYNFDAAKLKASYLAYEIGVGADSASMGRIEQIYDVAYNGVTKAAATDPKYCNDQRTKEIKTALSRHLAGDFTPTPTKVAAQDTGLFSGWGSGSSDDEGLKLKHPMDNR